MRVLVLLLWGSTRLATASVWELCDPVPTVEEASQCIGKLYGLPDHRIDECGAVTAWSDFGRTARNTLRLLKGWKNGCHMWKRLLAASGDNVTSVLASTIVREFESMLPKKDKRGLKNIALCELSRRFCEAVPPHANLCPTTERRMC